MTEPTTLQETERLALNPPPRVRLPAVLQGVAFAAFRRRFTTACIKRYGDTFTMTLPVFGSMVTVTDPAVAKQVFAANTDDVGNVQPNLSRIFGPGSVFALDRDEHRRRRKLLTPPFHGKSIKNYEKTFEEETLRELASWPEGVEFESIEPMSRITLNVILRAVFGAEGEQLDELRRIIPPWVTLGSRLAMLPAPKRSLGRHSPWGRLRNYRNQYNRVVDELIDTIRQDPDFEQRSDVLALLLRSSYEDGTEMSRRDIGDELLTLLAAGHETTASTLAWTFERISRHPEVLAKLVAEADTDDNEYRQATILETQRVRTVIDAAARHVYSPTFEFGEWVVPQGYAIRLDISHIHERSQEYPEPLRFDPSRFVGHRPTFSWIPFGGGTRRCVGAVFANVEMDVVLRTILRQFTIETTTAPDEKVFSRGVAFVPKQGGRITVRRR
jgi:cytochrome P450